jgi:hypothetical protein
MNRTLLILSSLLLVACSSCQTTKKSRTNYKITAYNNTDKPIKDFIIQYGDEIVGSSLVLDPKKERGQIRRIERIPATIRLKWKNAEGHPFDKTVTPKLKIPRPFRGELYVKISPAGGADIYVYPTFDPEESSIPWGKPADWEGSPSIPGLNQEG